MLLKECAKCAWTQEVTENFYADKTKKDGFQAYCKGCKREANKSWIANWREKNPAVAKERHRVDTRRKLENRRRRRAEREAAESGVLGG